MITRVAITLIFGVGGPLDLVALIEQESFRALESYGCTIYNTFF